MRRRPRTKEMKKSHFGRCPKCGKQTWKHQKRCKTCHQQLRVG